MQFISECAKVLVDALTHSLDKPEALLPAYALLNRVRLTASPAVLALAESLLTEISDQYFESNLSIEQLRALARSDDPAHATRRAWR